jgi:hypothetical protein
MPPDDEAVAGVAIDMSADVIPERVDIAFQVPLELL